MCIQVGKCYVDDREMSLAKVDKVEGSKVWYTYITRSRGLTEGSLEEDVFGEKMSLVDKNWQVANYINEFRGYNDIAHSVFLD